MPESIKPVETLAVFINQQQKIVEDMVGVEINTGIKNGYKELFKAGKKIRNVSSKVLFNLDTKEGLITARYRLQDIFLRYQEPEYYMKNGNLNQTGAFAWVRWENENQQAALNPVHSMVIIDRYGLLDGEQRNSGEIAQKHGLSVDDVDLMLDTSLNHILYELQLMHQSQMV